jgi:hypothetical protein
MQGNLERERERERERIKALDQNALRILGLSKIRKRRNC